MKITICTNFVRFLFIKQNNSSAFRYRVNNRNGFVTLICHFYSARRKKATKSTHNYITMKAIIGRRRWSQQCVIIFICVELLLGCCCSMVVESGRTVTVANREHLTAAYILSFSTFIYNNHNYSNYIPNGIERVCFQQTIVK